MHRGYNYNDVIALARIVKENKNKIVVAYFFCKNIVPYII
jgi:hypothetical protein